MFGNNPAGGSSGSGDLVGPSSATDNAIVRFDSTTGKLVQNSGYTINDAGSSIITIVEGAGSTPSYGALLDGAYLGIALKESGVTQFVNNSTAHSSIANNGVLTLNTLTASANARITSKGTGTTTADNIAVLNSSDVKTAWFTDNGNSFSTGSSYTYNAAAGYTNYERLFIGWAANQCYIYPEQSGSGSNRDLNIGTLGSATFNLIHAGSARWKITGANFLPVTTDSAVIGGTSNRVLQMFFGKTVTAAATVGAQTINKASGSVNFAAAATSLVVTNSLVDANSIIMCTVATNDVTFKSAQAVAGSGSFTIYCNDSVAGATAETRVNFLVFN